MEVTISQFRRDLFRLAESALEGEPITFFHKGVRFRVVPEVENDPFGRITPLQVINTEHPDLDKEDLQKEMERNWQEDWDQL